MMRYLLGATLLLAGCGQGGNGKQERMTFPIRLITLDPGHFHAALVQKSSYPEIDSVVHVYAPAGQELQAHMALIEKYNTRPDVPTKWKEVVYTGPDYLSRMLRERAGNVVVVAGNNQKKIGYIKAAIDTGLNVFADKPMIIEPKDLAVLEEVFREAKRKGVVLYDIMTERYQITTILQRELSLMPEVFGRLQKGTADDPAVTKESVHHFFKYVSGKPLIRPAWYYDVRQEGEGIVDVTTHLVDLVQWECFSDSLLDYKKDIDMLSARRWPTVITPSQFKLSTQLDHYPDFLSEYVKDSLLNVYANGEMNYTLKGVHVRVSVRWDFQAPEGGGDTHYSVMKGELANLVIRQGKEEGYKPVLYIEPVKISAAYDSSVRHAVASLRERWPGVSVEKTDKGWRVSIPEQFSSDHEATFAEVMQRYLAFVMAGRIPEWEESCMLAKYYTTIKALEVARNGGKH